MVLPSFAPLIGRVRQRLTTLSLLDRADRSIELEPAAARTRPPAIALPGEFERASGYFMPREMERQRVEGGRHTDGATVAHVLHDAVVAGGAVYCRGAVDSYRPGATRVCLTGPEERRASGLLATSRCAEIFFGDWLVEALSLELLAVEHGRDPVGFAKSPWLHEPGYRALTGLQVRPATRTRFDELWIVDDRGLNAGRAARFRELRRRIRAASGAGGPKRVFLARGQLGNPRDIANAAAVEAMLTGLGYTILRPEEETPAAIARALGDAEIVVNVEGSSSVHAALAIPEGAFIVNLQPPHRFTAPAKDFADMAGLRYGYVVCDAAGAGFAVDPERLWATLALVEAEL